MKHTAKVTAILVFIFLFSQVFGLYTLNTDIEVVRDADTGEVLDIIYSEPAIGERPDLEEAAAFWYIIIAVLVGTLLLLLLMRFRQFKIWKAWFFLAVWLTITITLGIYINTTAAYIIGFSMALIKIFKPNFFVQNLSEVFMYTGIAILFVPLLNVFWMLVLLLVISLYDAYAVWKSKHMVKMANFQTESKVFAGLTIPYKKSPRGSEVKIEITPAKNYKTEKGERIAILGGGDIAFPLLFSGAVMQSLVLDMQLSKMAAFLEVQLVTLFVTIALIILLTYGKKDRFYPAMPFLTAGALIGYGAIFLLHLFI